MYKETIKYLDYDGNEREEDYYFNLSKGEIAEMELSTAGGLEKALTNIINSKDQKRIVETFKEIILMSYGEKSPDGKYFMKKDENGRPLVDKFVQTEAYSELFMKLATDSKAGAKFINGIVPKELSEAAEKNKTVEFIESKMN